MMILRLKYLFCEFRVTLYSTRMGRFYFTQKEQKTQKLFFSNTDGTELTDYSFITSKNSEKPKKVSY